jgi:hypothetical protein
MKRTLGGWLAATAVATILGLAAGACGSRGSGQLSHPSRVTSDPIAFGKRPVQRTFCAQLHLFEYDARHGADATVVERDFDGLVSDAQSTPWSGVIHEVINQFQSGHMGIGYKVLATLDPDCR